MRRDKSRTHDGRCNRRSDNGRDFSKEEVDWKELRGLLEEVSLEPQQHLCF